MMTTFPRSDAGTCAATRTLARRLSTVGPPGAAYERRRHDLASVAHRYLHERSHPGLSG